MSLTKEEIFEFTEENIVGFKMSREDRDIKQAWKQFFLELGYNPYIKHEIIFRYDDDEKMYTIGYDPRTVVYGDEKRTCICELYLGIQEYDKSGSSGNVRKRVFE